MSHDDEKKLEKSWDGRHQMHFSMTNAILNPVCRDYFDRPREIATNQPGVSKKNYRSSWQLNSGYVIKDKSRDADGNPKQSKRRVGWDGRHGVTVSENNHVLGENDREYFSRFVDKRADRLLPQQQKGLTRHYQPIRLKGNSEGVDDPHTHSELLLRAPSGTNLRASAHKLPSYAGGQSRDVVSGLLPPLSPQSILPALARSGYGGGSASSSQLVSHAPGRPDSSFDQWGD